MRDTSTANVNPPSGAGASPCPVSLIQLQFWLLHHFAPESPAYHLPSVCAVEGPLHVEALENALNAILRRHPVFRSTFHIEESGQVVQRAAPWQRIRLPQDDLRVPGGGRADDQAVKQALLGEIRRPFDLASGPPIRFRLLQIDERLHMLVINAHHIVFDLVTKDLFAGELAEEYRKALSGPVGDEPVEIADYAAFSAWERDWMGSDERKKMEASWRKFLEGVEPSLNLPAEIAAEARQSHPDPASPVPLALPREAMAKIHDFCGKENVTPFLVLLTAWALTMARWSSQAKMSVGIPMTNRRKEEFKETMGCFVNILPMPFDISDHPTFREAIRRVRMNILQMHRMQEMPYYHLVQMMRQEGRIGGNALFQTGFTFEHPMRLRLEGLDVRPLYIHPGGAQLDLFATFWEEADSIVGVMKYDNGRFLERTVEKIGESFLEIVGKICDDAQRKVDEVVVLREKRTDRDSFAPGVAAISASFTAEVLQEFLDFWFQKLGWRREVRFAQFNQVFQELLNPSSLLRSNRRGHNLVMVRLDDLLGAERETIAKNPAGIASKLSRVLDDLLDAVNASVQAAAAPLFFVLCPSSPDSEAILLAEHEKIERFLAALRSIPGVTVLTPEEISRRYPVSEYDEPFGEAIGRVPFTRSYLTALATAVVRAMHAQSLKPIKALVVDCDGTLWNGVSAEDGATGVTIGPLQRDFQKFLLDQYETGVMLCICSKNQEDDVWAVFDRHPDMLLRREHFTFWRINWEPKSSNLRSLAREINIGLDAMAFLDDSPLERAEIGARCPSVFCVEFPHAWEQRTKWMEHLWALDHGRVTAEDRKRQEHYRSEQLRENIKKSSGSFQDFLEKLELRVDLHPAGPSDYERLGQLSVRTNQFHTTQLRLTTQEVLEYAETPGLSAHVAKVSDRFGDYGLVGGMLARAARGILQVDGLFLSCRALGRGVEYGMAAYLASVARAAGCSVVEFLVKTTDRNEPARAFMAQITRTCDGHVDDDGRVQVSTDRLATIRYEPPSTQEGIKTENAAGDVFVGSDESASTDRGLVFSIARELCSVPGILEAVERRTREEQKKRGTQVLARPAAPPETKTERIIADAWKHVLGLNAVSSRAKFFEVGGTSLLMVRIAVELKKNHGLEVTIPDLFQYPTIADLAAFLDRKSPIGDVAGRVVEAAVRQREALSEKNLPASFQRLRKARASE